eukprot:TRINITY_DN41275_c0_g1_i1.p3 TRINITY_DN41275_c0_g1~~TRINITY_DN41275_c0_g1_i1.p3  ORF type:complete len:123 (-),score=26.87 TRINITY_DN41275_c0_g1_i1:128-496(-)
MDPVRTANLKAFVAQAPKDGKAEGLPAAAATKFERKLLAEARRKRDSMGVLERMEADADQKAAFTQVCDMRQNAHNRRALDRMVKGMRPEPPKAGPTIASHNSKNLFEGHDKEQQWAPLEYY